MTCVIVFFKNNRGDEIVKNDIRRLEKHTIAKVAHHIDLLMHHGPSLSMPYSKKLSSKIYELRIRGKQEIRILYTFFKNQIYILHLFQKKTQKTPQRELKIAEERYLNLTKI